MGAADKSLVITVMVITLALVAIILVSVLVTSTIRQQRRYLRTRDHLGGRLLTAQDEERAAIAREIHDDAVNRLNILSNELKHQGEFVVAAVVAAKVDGLARDLRALSRGIHPTVVDVAGLDAALRELAESMKAREGMVVEYEGPAGLDDLSPPRRLALYRVAQEALGNVAHHAGVKHAEMRLSRDSAGTRLTIADEGKGFDRRTAATGPGIGVTSMGERLAILGGSLDLDSGPGRGTRVTAFLPAQARTG